MPHSLSILLHQYDTSELKLVFIHILNVCSSIQVVLNLLLSAGSLRWVVSTCLDAPPSQIYFLRSVALSHLCQETTGGSLYSLADYMQLAKGPGTLMF